MAISLRKGSNVSLTKEAPSMKKIRIGLGWDIRLTNGAQFDLDAVGFLLGEHGKVLSDSSFVFYNNTSSECGSLLHSGDNRTGEGSGDDETLLLELDRVPERVKKVIVAVTIHEAASRGQNFGMVSNAFIRCVNDESKEEVARFDLSEDASAYTTIIFGELYRQNREWKFKALGQGYDGGLGSLAITYGVNIG